MAEICICELPNVVSRVDLDEVEVDPARSSKGYVDGGSFTNPANARPNQSENPVTSDVHN
jgi:hypothetical protein